MMIFENFSSILQSKFIRMNVDYTLISIGYHTSIYQQFLKENIEPNDLIEFIEWGNAKKEK